MNNNKRVNEDNGKKIVQVLVEFVRFGEIDTMNEKFIAELNIEAKWTDEIPSMADDQTDLFDPDKHWNPRLFVENVLQEPKEKISYEMKPVNDCDSGGGSTDQNNNTNDECKKKLFMIVEKRNIKGVFWERLEWVS